MLVEKLLSPAFDDILDVNYTRELEEDLDKIEDGTDDYESTLTSFYKKFQKDLKRAAKEMINLKEGVEPDPTVDVRQVRQADGDQGRQVRPVPRLQRLSECENTRELETPEAGAEGGDRGERARTAASRWRSSAAASASSSPAPAIPSARRRGRSSRPSRGMTAAKPDQILDEKCPKCESNLVIKQGRFGEFTACSNYPTCKYVKQKSTGVLCPKDGGDIVERKSRRGKVFFGCANYPDCDFTLWNRPVAEKCPDCGAPFLVEKITKKHGRQLICNNEECSLRAVGGTGDRREAAVESNVKRPHFSRIRFSIAMIHHHRRRAWPAAKPPGRPRRSASPSSLHEMRPVRPTAVHKTDGLAELVCSNSFRGDKLDNAVGLLKEEMRRLGSLVMRAADEARVPGRRRARRRSRPLLRRRDARRSRRIR